MREPNSMRGPHPSAGEFRLVPVILCRSLITKLSNRVPDQY